MSLLNDIGASTVGVLWRAASGTVDPWTRDNLIEDAQGNAVASLGPNATPDQVNAAKQQAAVAINSSLNDATANSAQFWDGVLKTPSTVWAWLTGGNVATGEPGKKTMDEIHSFLIWGVVIVFGLVIIYTATKTAVTKVLA